MKEWIEENDLKTMDEVFERFNSYEFISIPDRVAIFHFVSCLNRPMITGDA